MTTAPPVAAPAATATVLDLLRAGREHQARTVLAHQPSAGARSPRSQALLHRLAVDALLAAGDLAGAQQHAEAGLAVAEDHQGHPDRPWIRAVSELTRADVAVAAGRPQAALEHFLAVGALHPEQDDVLDVWREGAALALVRVGRRAEGATLAEEHLALARGSGQPALQAAALRLGALVLAAWDTEGRLREALALLVDHEHLRLRLQIECDLAGLLALSPLETQRAEAVVLLRRVEAHAGREGLRPLHTRVAGVLGRLGESPEPTRREAMTALSRPEAFVARAAAAGLSNREIATRLRVSVKSVEWHLSQVYRKLGIGSRRRLGEALGLPSLPSLPAFARTAAAQT